MYWKEIRKSKHYIKYHSHILSWDRVIQLIYLIKNKRKIGDCIQIENKKIYILCKIKNKVLYVINVKIK